MIGFTSTAATLQGHFRTKPPLTGPSQQPQLSHLPKDVYNYIVNLVETCPWLCWDDFDYQTVRSVLMCCRCSKQATIVELERLVGTQPGNIRSMAAFITRNMNNLYWSMSRDGRG